MKRYLRRGGSWLAGAGGISALGYLTATQAASGSHPLWPYLIFLAMVIGGLAIYFLVHEEPAGPTLTKEYTEDKLVAGFNSFAVRMELAANSRQPENYPYPAQHMDQFVATLNETFDISIATPSDPVAPGEFVNYFMARVRSRDPVGAALFRVGGELGAWWQGKGRHDSQVDLILETNVKDALDELDQLVPQSAKRTEGVLTDYRNRDTTSASDHLTREFLQGVVSAIVA